MMTTTIQIDEIVKNNLDELKQEVIQFYAAADAAIDNPTYSMIVGFLVSRYNKEIRKK